MRDKLIGAVIALSKASMHGTRTEEGNRLLIDCLASPHDLKDNEYADMTAKVENEKYISSPNCRNCLAPCGNTNNYDMNIVNNSSKDIKEAKELLLNTLETISKILQKRGEYAGETVDYVYHAIAFISYDFDSDKLKQVNNRAFEVLNSLNGSER